MIAEVKKSNRKREYPEAVGKQDLAFLTMAFMAQEVNAAAKKSDKVRGLVNIHGDDQCPLK